MSKRSFDAVDDLFGDPEEMLSAVMAESEPASPVSANKGEGVENKRCNKRCKVDGCTKSARGAWCDSTYYDIIRICTIRKIGYRKCIIPISYYILYFT